MNGRPESPGLRSPYLLLPLRLVIILGLSIFIIELGIMWLPLVKKPGLDGALLDAGLLTIFVAPLLYVTVFRALKNEIVERGLAQTELLRAQAELEVKVKDRTWALTESLEKLQNEVVERRRAQTQLVREVASRVAAEEALQRRVAELDALQHIEHLLADRKNLDGAISQACGHVSWLLSASHSEVELSGEPANDRQGRNELRVPLVVKGELVGQLWVGRPEEAAPFAPEDERLAHTVADRLAAVVENERLRAKERERAAAEERDRLARDLHDAVTQSIYSANLIAEALPALWERNPREGLGNLERLRLLVRGALAEMRTLLTELRPSTLESTDVCTLLERLGDALAGQIQIPVDVRVAEDIALPSDVKVVCYRVVQEAFSNIAKHSAAKNASALLVADAARVMLEVRDDGCGFDPEDVSSQHMGLRIMRERLDAIGASVSIKSSPGEGTVILMEWPRHLASRIDESRRDGS